jgi:hypothetical protein
MLRGRARETLRHKAAQAQPQRPVSTRVTNRQQQVAGSVNLLPFASCSEGNQPTRELSQPQIC